MKKQILPLLGNIAFEYQPVANIAKTFDIRNAKEIIEEVKTAASNWFTYADKAEVTNASRKKITKVLDRLIVG